MSALSAALSYCLPSPSSPSLSPPFSLPLSLFRHAPLQTTMLARTRPPGAARRKCTSALHASVRARCTPIEAALLLHERGARVVAGRKLLLTDIASALFVDITSGGASESNLRLAEEVYTRICAGKNSLHARRGRRYASRCPQLAQDRCRGKGRLSARSAVYTAGVRRRSKIAETARERFL